MIYLGPYLLCIPRKEKYLRTLRTCPTKSCHRHRLGVPASQGDYCPFCGSKISNLDFEEERDDPDPYDILLEIGERLYSQTCPPSDGNFPSGGRVWFANVPIPEVRKFHVNQEEIIPIHADLIHQETRKFQHYFRIEIAELNKAYKPDNVSLRWGLLHLYSS